MKFARGTHRVHDDLLMAGIDGRTPLPRIDKTIFKGWGVMKTSLMILVHVSSDTTIFSLSNQGELREIHYNGMTSSLEFLL